MRKVSLALLSWLLISAAFLRISSAQDDQLKVVASFTILADVASRVGGDHVQVASLMPYNADPHTFEPTAQDVATLAEADLVLVSGAFFEEGLLETVANAGEAMNIVTVSQCVQILPFGEHEGEVEHTEEHAQDTNGSELAAQCAAHYAELGLEADTGEENHEKPLGMLYQIECGHEHEEDSGSDEHEQGNCDPHLWTKPQNVMLWTLMLRDIFTALDPDHANLFVENAAAYLSELAALQAELQTLIDSVPEERRVLVTNHETLGYFADFYHFKIVGTVIPSAGAASQPSAAEVARLIETIQAADVPAIFAETTLNPDLAKQIAEETGAKVLTLYSDSLSEPDGDAPTYLDYMRYNVQTIVNGLTD